MDTNTNLSVLLALFELARQNRPAHVERVAGRLGLDTDATRRALRALEARGLADAMRVRLTLAGLAVASSAARGQDVVAALAA